MPPGVLFLVFCFCFGYFQDSLYLLLILVLLGICSQVLIPGMRWLHMFLPLLINLCICSYGIGKNISSIPPSVVNIGALFTFNSTIGRSSKIAIQAAVDDINSASGILEATKLVVKMQDSNSNNFLGIMEGLQFMESSIVAIVGPQSSVLAHVLSHVAYEVQVPLLSFSATDPTLSPIQYPFFVRTTHSDLFQMSAIAEMIDHYNWDQIIAIYIDDDSGRNGVQLLGDKLQKKRCKIAYKAALPPKCTKNGITDLLVKLALMESRVFVLHANPENGIAIFSVAHTLGITGNSFVWIATDWLSSVIDTASTQHSLSKTMNLIQGVVGLRQHIPDSGRRTAFLSRWKTLAKEEGHGYIGLNSYALYAYDSVWTIARAVNEFLNSGGVISFSKDTKLEDMARVRGGGGGSKLHLEAMSVFDGGKLLLNEILKTDTVGLTGPIRFDSERQLARPAYDIINIVGTGYRTVGYWSNHSGLSVEPPEKLYSKPVDAFGMNSGRLKTVFWPGETTIQPRGWVFPQNGRQLRIGIPYRASYRQFVSKSRDSNAMSGFCIDVFLASVNLVPYAVPYQFIPFGDGRRNPSYSKLVSMVASGEFDAAIGDIAIVTNRTKIVDFTQPFVESGLVILVAVEKRSMSTWAFLRPFTLGMWIVTAGFFLVVGTVVWILEHRFNTEFRGPLKKQVVTIFWFSLSTLFFSHRENTVSTLGRSVVLIWLFVVLIIQSSYTATLTSILTVKQLSSEIKDIKSLIESGDPIGFQVGSFAENYMVEQLGISRSRLRTLDTPDDYANALVLGPDDGGVAAIIDERPYIDAFLSTQGNFKIVGSEFTRSGWGFAFPLDSPLAVDMSTAILALSENGELHRIHNKWLTRSECASPATTLNSDRLHLSSFYGLFLICAVTCFLALIIYSFMILLQFFRHISDVFGLIGIV